MSEDWWAREAAKLQAAWAHGHDELVDECALCQGGVDGSDGPGCLDETLVLQVV